MIANEVVGEDKVLRLVRLAKRCKIAVAVDDRENVRQISSIAAREGSTIRVLVDLNLSSALEGVLDRTGVRGLDEAVGLAQEVSRLPGLRFSGLMGYEGSLRAFPDEGSKREACERALAKLVTTGEGVRRAGLEVETLSCGGTMSYSIAAEYPGVTEVQAGGYVFMDGGYRASGIDFETSLTLLTRVVSRPRPGKLIVDAGYKAISAESGLPEVKGNPGLQVVALNAEHGHISSKNGEEEADPSNQRLGSRLELLPAHADTTTCLHDEYVLIKGGEAYSRSPVAARGKLE